MHLFFVAGPSRKRRPSMDSTCSSIASEDSQRNKIAFFKIPRVTIKRPRDQPPADRARKKEDYLNLNRIMEKTPAAHRRVTEPYIRTAVDKRKVADEATAELAIARAAMATLEKSSEDKNKAADLASSEAALTSFSLRHGAALNDIYGNLTDVFSNIEEFGGMLLEIAQLYRATISNNDPDKVQIAFVVKK